MDRISLLSDDLILKILSLLPTKDAVTTSLLSKRWTSLWQLVPRLNYRDRNGVTDAREASRFIEKFLLLHKAPVLKTLCLSLGRNCPPTDIETWIRIAISRGLRKVVISKRSVRSGFIQFPRSLFTCETLVVLSIRPARIVDVPSTICFRSVKQLRLFMVEFPSDEIVARLLSGCPVLIKLTIMRCNYDNVKTFTIDVPSLQKLYIMDSEFDPQIPRDEFGFVIRAPSLKRLQIANQLSWCYSLIDMPNLVEADIKLAQGDFKKFKGSLASATHLTLCVKPQMDFYTIGTFTRLMSLNLCICSLDWCHLILKHAPKLRFLRFFQHRVRLFPNIGNLPRCCSSYNGDVAHHWEQPSSVPPCLVSSLKAVEWIDYKGTEAEKKVVVYLLENTRKLETMAISSSPSTILAENHKMLIELASMQRSSSQCRLSFT